MRADRLLHILLLLQRHPRVTASELAEQLEVSVRTIYRDMEALSASGIPVFADRGANGGWSLLEGYRTLVSGLKEHEIRALFTGQSARILSELGWQQSTDSAMTKLLLALPEGSRNVAAIVSERLYVDSTGWHDSRESIPFLPLLQEAVWQQRRLQLTYQKNDGTVIERLVDPLGLVVKGYVWYLIASTEKDIRSYRVSRVQDAAVTDLIFVRPASFHLAEYWTRSTAQFVSALPSFTLVFTTSPQQLSYIRTKRYVRIMHEELEIPRKQVRVTASFDTEEEACQFAVGLGNRIEVVAPETLREQIVSRALEVLGMYAPNREYT
ncbi:MAG: helix-turn-helix transcriptional regulator [Clostridia bacterium]